MVFDNINGENRVKKILAGAVSTGRLPGAYIFAGQNTEEMSGLCAGLAQLLNCPEVCGSCLNCSKLEKGVHPDFITLAPEGKKQIIKIETIRELKDRIKFGPSEGSFLVVRVLGAESMEAPAANSFLKTLEEPPARVLFVLITQRPDNLPKTIVSRCQKLIFANPGARIDEVRPPDIDGDVLGSLAFSESLVSGPKETERTSVLRNLEGLLLNFREKRKPAKARIVMDAVRKLQKMGNTRLTLDDMALKLGGVC